LLVLLYKVVLTLEKELPLKIAQLVQALLKIVVTFNMVNSIIKQINVVAVNIIGDQL
jgi:hypothetical protein